MFIFMDFFLFAIWSAEVLYLGIELNNETLCNTK